MYRIGIGASEQSLSKYSQRVLLALMTSYFKTRQGEWIRKLGFNVQDHVLVSEKQGQLIINLEVE